MQALHPLMQALHPLMHAPFKERHGGPGSQTVVFKLSQRTWADRMQDTLPIGLGQVKPGCFPARGLQLRQKI